MGPYDQYRKLGDLGNVQITSVKQGGQSQFSLFDDIVTLEGPFSVEGMSMNIHYDPFGDDLGQYKPALTETSTAADITAEMGKMGASMAAGLHDGATDGGLLNPIACGGIKKFTAPTVQKTAHMELDMTVGGNSIQGTLTFEEIKMPAGSSYNTNLKTDNGVMTRITGIIYGLENGQHGFHVHANWDGKTCGGTGYIFDPLDVAQIPGGDTAFDPPTVLPANTMAHGSPMNAYKDGTSNTRMAGDLGNILSSVNGQANVYIMDPEIMLTGANSIVGHSVDIHTFNDTLKGPLPDLSHAADVLWLVGGAPVACGEIKEGEAPSNAGTKTSTSAGLGSGAIAAIIIGVVAAAGAAAFIFFRSATPGPSGDEELRLELEKGGNNL
jgi:Cu-Zn family superoxide dismutase